MRFPHFDFYPGDWLHDARNRYLSLAARGAHIDLLSLMWNEATPERFGLLDDDQGLSRALGVPLDDWRALRAELIDGPYAVLVREGDYIISPRLREEWEKACQRSETARRNRLQRRFYDRTTAVQPAFNGGSTTVQRPYHGGTTSHQEDLSVDDPIAIDPTPRQDESPSPKQGDQKTRRASSKRARRGDPRAAELLAYFAEQFQARYGQPYPVVHGRDLKKLQALLGPPMQYAPEQLRAWMHQYFAQPDPYWVRKGQDVPKFVQALPQLIAQHARDRPLFPGPAFEPETSS